MPRRTPETPHEGAVRACVEVLRGFGVTADHVRSEWDVSSDASLRAAVRTALPAAETPAAFVRETLAGGPRGIDAPVEFWNNALQIQLEDIFDAVQSSVTVYDSNGDLLNEGDLATGPFTIEVTDVNGVRNDIVFDYPDTPIGDDNYPAVMHALNDQLLADTKHRFVRIEGPERRWRFALVQVEKLAALEGRYGDRVAIDDEPILAAHQPVDFVPVQGGMDLPEWVKRHVSEDGPAIDREAGDAETVQDAVETDADSILDDDELAALVDGEGEVDAGHGPAAGAGETDAASTDGGVVTESFGSFVDDLGGVDAEEITPEPPDVEAAEPSDRAAGSTDDAPLDLGQIEDEGGLGDGLEGVFGEMERDVATEDAGRDDETQDADLTAIDDDLGDAFAGGEETVSFEEDQSDTLASDVFGAANEAGEATDDGSADESAGSTGSADDDDEDGEFEWVDT